MTNESSSAEFSPCREYRYALWRWWDKSNPYLMVIGLNPSTADEKNDDPTIRRCKRFAKDWGFGGLCMANLFALRATNPKDMMNHFRPIGDDNDEWLSNLSDGSGMTLAAWGNHGSYMDRDLDVCEFVVGGSRLMCLGKTKPGAPRHPLYVKADTQPVEFRMVGYE